MAYTLRINDTYVQSSALDITAAVQKYIESDDSTELVVYSDNRYRSRGPLLDLSVIDSRYTVLELTGVSVYNIDSLYDTVEILDVHNAGEYTTAGEVLNVLPLSIEQLSLTYYRITGSIGPAIEDFDRLIVLDLSRNELSGQLDLYLPILRELYLDYNSIDSIADSVYSMDSLVILSMKYNRLKRNPTKRLNSMKSLEYVDLRGNPFYDRRRS